MKKVHKWASLIISIFLMLTSASGIIMNHRGLFSTLDVSRRLLHEDYRYYNWNLAAVKGFVNLPSGEKLLYGNIGIWKTDSAFKSFEDFNSGFKSGIDRRKTFTLLRSGSGRLFAGTLFGLYRFDEGGGSWKNIPLPEGEARVVKIIEQGEKIVVLTRSYLYELDGDSLTRLTIPAPRGYAGKVGLFRTLWVIHSGEIYGPAGRLIVDLGGITLLFLSLSGLCITFLPLAARLIPQIKSGALPGIKRLTTHWHGRIGFYGFVILILVVLTGSFLRPPLLLLIANSFVNPIPFTKLAGSNVWEDRLRDIAYDKPSGEFIISTGDGFIHFRPGDENAGAFRIEPPVSIMGITVFEPLPDGNYLVGSFNGLYLWNPRTGMVANALVGLPSGGESAGNPLDVPAVTGAILQEGHLQAVFDYNSGWIPLNETSPHPEMPESIRSLPFSLWNLSQEIHTGRILSPVIGSLYILYVPLMGLATLLVIITGIWIWLRRKDLQKIVNCP